jgi:hypothetical protein
MKTDNKNIKVYSHEGVVTKRPHKNTGIHPDKYPFLLLKTKLLKGIFTYDKKIT